ncbi:DUF397 domain-containing protein [Actinoallomurus purpureus]
MLDVSLTALWRKSTYTGQGGADCVEVAALSHTISTRDARSADDA